jgi:glycosyltransferase involved in cell wall biosynthesis
MIENMIKYSFIIPTKEINTYIRNLIPKIAGFNRDDFEILVYPDQITDEYWGKTRQVASFSLDPAGKRNLALRDAKGEIFIFIDDDAYPESNFLEILDKDFSSGNISAVGGPALTPAESNFWQRVSGAMFLSHLSGGFPERYRPIGKKKFVSDWPTVNLSIRKKIFEEIGGFQCRYWPGEDTYLCYELLVKKNIQVLYDPDLIVYHHRRESLKQHLRQISAYGIHRGFFVKKFSRTSLNWRYFMPSFLVVFIVFGGILSFFSETILKVYVLGWIIYFVALLNAFYDIWKHERSFLVSTVAIYYIFLSHIFYGFRFMQGLFITRELKSKLR